MFTHESHQLHDAHTEARRRVYGITHAHTRGCLGLPLVLVLALVPRNFAEGQGQLIAATILVAPLWSHALRARRLTPPAAARMHVCTLRIRNVRRR